MCREMFTRSHLCSFVNRFVAREVLFDGHELVFLIATLHIQCVIPFFANVNLCFERQGRRA